MSEGAIEEYVEVCDTFVYELRTARSFRASMGLPNQAVLDNQSLTVTADTPGVASMGTETMPS